MRALVLAFTLLAACGGGLKLHAQAASAAYDLLEAVRVEIGHQEWEDVREIRLDGIDVERREAVAKASWMEVEARYEAAAAAHTAYVEALRQANDRGDERLAAEPARALLGAWVALAEAGDRMGVHVEPPPAALLERVKESP